MPPDETADSQVAIVVDGELVSADNPLPTSSGGGGGEVDQGTGGSSPWLVKLDQTGTNNDVNLGSEYLEDAEHTNGEKGVFILGVRNDLGSDRTSDNGDYAPISTDAAGRIAIASGTTGPAQKEDLPHGSGDMGMFILGVRNDTGFAHASGDGDYTPIATDAAGALRTPTGTLTDRSDDITTGDTAQDVMAANTSRKYLLFQNISDTDMWINFTSNAVKDSPSIKIAASGGSFVMEGSFVSTEKLTVICASAGKKYTAKEG